VENSIPVWVIQAGASKRAPKVSFQPTTEAGSGASGGLVFVLVVRILSPAVHPSPDGLSIAAGFYQILQDFIRGVGPNVAGASDVMYISALPCCSE
jgi:hypothetical protein